MASRKHETDDSDIESVMENACLPKKKRRVVQKYRQSYHEKFPCLIPSDKGNTYVHCTICKADFGCGHGGLFDCTRHIQSASHKKYQMGCGSQQVIKSFFERKKDNVSDMDMDTMRAEAMLCDMIVDGNLPLANADRLVQSLKIMAPDSKIIQSK